MDNASTITAGAQVVSQLRSKQQVASKNSKTSLKTYFSRQAGVERCLVIRGGKEQRVTLLQVKAHGKRRFVVALKYEGEVKYRYILASTRGVILSLLRRSPSVAASRAISPA